MTPSTATARPPLAWSTLALAGLPGLLFFALIIPRAANIPVWDDYQSVLPFTCDWRATEAWSERLPLLFAQYYSHRIVATKLAALATLAGGSLNFLALQALGWLAWAGVLLLAARALRAAVPHPWLVLPLSLLLMQPQGYSNHLIAMQAVQNLGVLVTAFGALALLAAAERRRFAAGVCLGVAAPFVSVNGLLVLPVAALAAWMSGRRPRTLGLALLAGAVWAAYFAGYDNPQKPLAVAAFAANAAVMAGAPFALFTLDHRHAAVAGALLLGLAGLALARPALWRASPLLAAGLGFIVLSILMAARGRIGWGAAYMLQDRYRVYGVLLLALLYALAVVHLPAFRRPVVFAPVLGAAFLFCAASYLSAWPLLDQQARWSQATALNRALGQWFPQISLDCWDSSVRNLQRAEQAGVYRLPAVAVDFARVGSPRVADPAVTLTARPDADAQGFSLVPAPSRPAPAFGVVVGGDAPVVVPVNRWRARLVEMPRRLSPFGDGWSFLLPAPLASARADRVVAFGPDGRGGTTPEWTAALQGL